MSLFKKKMNDEIPIASFNRSNATVTDSELTEVFTEVGSRYGYADVKAKFRLSRISRSSGSVRTSGQNSLFQTTWTGLPSPR